jgi:hypothetical protein
MEFIIIQAIGFVAVGLSIFAYQYNKRATMLGFDMSAAFLYALHFFLLGAPTGGAMNFIGGVRAAIYYKYPPTKARKWIFVLFMFSSCLATYYFWEGFISLLALGGTLSYGIAYWQTNPKYIRRYLLLSFPLWFAYNFIVGSYPGMLIELILLASNLIGQYRFDYLKKLTIK